MIIHFLKTEWSDIIILQQGNSFAMVDTGFEEQFGMIKEYLDGLGAGKLEFIINTHFHRDHYGSLPLILDNYKVDKVYMKEYSALDCTTAWGTEADDEYRRSELGKYQAMLEGIRKKSALQSLEGIKSVWFEDIELKLYNTDNNVKKIYEDSAYPESYHRITFSENENSIGIFFRADGKKVFLGGDIMDHPSSHPLADYVNLRIAEEIGETIDLYKAPHHATVNTGCPKTLSIYRPQTVVITNGSRYVRECSDIENNLREVNPMVRILYTENENVVIDLEKL